MSAGVKIAAFVGALAAIFAVASLAGAAIDPSVDATPEHVERVMEGHDAAPPAGHSEHPDESSAAGPLPGLATATGGYRLLPDRTRFDAESGAEFGFRIVDERGEVVSDFETEHERRMHLIMVRRDFAAFQHLHPRQLPDGSWEAELDLEQPGVYRAFADFAVSGRSLTLAGDVFAAGRFQPQDLPRPSATDDAGGGYEVEIGSTGPQAGESTPVRFIITRDGRKLDGVDPYLGADGHLVALREHDQAFLHTHPEGKAGGDGPISFQVHYPTPGNYRLFLQFKHGGEVRTAAFTQPVETGRGTGDGHDETHDAHGRKAS